MSRIFFFYFESHLNLIGTTKIKISTVKKGFHVRKMTLQPLKNIPLMILMDKAMNCMFLFTVYNKILTWVLSTKSLMILILYCSSPRVRKKLMIVYVWAVECTLRTEQLLVCACYGCIGLCTMQATFYSSLCTGYDFLLTKGEQDLFLSDQWTIFFPICTCNSFSQIWTNDPHFFLLTSKIYLYLKW